MANLPMRVDPDIGPDLFISYPSSARRQATKVKGVAEGLGLSVFMDQQIMTGDRWTTSLRDAVRACHFFFLIVPPTALSDWMSIELGAAWVTDKPLRALLLGATENDRQRILKKLPEAVTETQCASFRKHERVVMEAADCLKKDNHLRVEALSGRELRFDFSTQAFCLIPSRFRDEFNLVQEWVDEATRLAAEDPRELYFVASYNGEVVGVLYATLYCLEGRCFINSFVVREDRHRCGRKNVAQALYREAERKVRSLVGGPFQGFIFEIPKPREMETRKERLRWKKLLRTLRLGKKRKPLVCRGVDYLMPASLRRFRGDTGTPAELLILPTAELAESIPRQEFLEDWLEFVYRDWYGGAAEDQKEEKDYLAYLDRLLGDARKGIAGPVRLREWKA